MKSKTFVGIVPIIFWKSLGTEQPFLHFSWKDYRNSHSHLATKLAYSTVSHF
jgi:hypothetical protein